MNFHTAPHTFVSAVHLLVEDLERSFTFYTELLGFTLFDKSDNQIRLTADNLHPILTIEQPKHIKPKVRRTTGLYHFAILLPRRSDLAKSVLHLRNNQWPIASSDHHVSEAIYLSDPDGNGIELYTDRDPALWQWQKEQVHMTVDPLDFESLLSEIHEDTEWSRIPPETEIGHIHLHVSHIDEAERFYRDALGFDVVCRYGAQASFLSTGKYHHHIAINTWAGVGAPTPTRNEVGLKQFTLIYPSENARSQAIYALHQKSFEVIEDNKKVLTFDPSGQTIELDILK
ncbi:VOC family protein [Halalkalibacter sp. APA_J-10(15)]|uniref:VOC family protein n=1 Tax=Halalkalibacter sp. APA_J-10(15) TaxID=2933805 RepID=UPI001FF4922E|nr:VOC family protein [Halalkalibacter sp. APA_J-10(15)]MCK0472396.1 VOC family protein [Halalkalibacter sp. APA_J-10(15)]